MDADSIPMVIPFVHTGMQEVMPIGAHIPKIGKKVDSCLQLSSLSITNTYVVVPAQFASGAKLQP